jgi:hypothetical protein
VISKKGRPRSTGILIQWGLASDSYGKSNRVPQPQLHHQNPVNIFQPPPSHHNPQTTSSRTTNNPLFRNRPSLEPNFTLKQYQPQPWMTGTPSRKLEPRPAGAEQHGRQSSEANPHSTPPKEAEPSSAQRRSSALETLYVLLPLPPPRRTPTNIPPRHRHPNPASKANISQR